MFIHLNAVDIHGITHPSPKVFYELELSFLVEYCRYNTVHLITIGGDTFHKLYDGDSDELKYMILFFKDLSNICREKNIKLRIIRGTLSHDKNQLNLLQFCSDICDAKIIEDDVTYEEFDNGLVFRYIPEPYGDHNAFENRIKEQSADVTVFHGTMMGKEWHIDRNYKPSEVGSILINPSLLEEYTNLYIIGGHFHVRSKYYTGSFSSNTFEDANQKKGFDIFIHDKGGVSNKFIENKSSRKFIVKDFTHQLQHKHVDDVKRELHLESDKLGEFDKLRLDIELSVLNDDSIHNVHMFMNIFKDIKFNLKRTVIEDLKRTEDKKNKVDNILSKDMSEIIYEKYKSKGGQWSFEEVKLNIKEA